MPPSSIFMIRSANSKMRPSCVTMTMQRLSVRMCCLTNVTMFRPVSPSSDAVGSSRIRMSGRLTMARAMATRCCSPPLSFTGGSCARSFSPTTRGLESASLSAASQSALLQDQRNRDVLRASSGAGTGDSPGTRSRSCAAGTRRAGRRRGSRYRCPRSSPCPLFGRRMPEIMLSSVVLPLPDGPTTYRISPKLASKFTSLTACVRASPSPNHLLRPTASIAVPAMVTPENVEGLDAQHLAHADVAGDRRRSRSPCKGRAAGCQKLMIAA